MTSQNEQQPSNVQGHPKLPDQILGGMSDLAIPSDGPDMIHDPGCLYAGWPTMPCTCEGEGGMSDHLPECPLSLPKVSPMDFHLDFPQDCICPALRACEKRVRNEEALAYTDAVIHTHPTWNAYDAGYAAAREDERQAHTDYCSRYTAGLDAAREAVAALDAKNPYGSTYFECKEDALAAIDALREGSN